jgi:predicted fused transcriptional regulator/phosphomethylpyrimidine kinase
MTKDTEIQRGRHATNLLNDELVVEILNAMEQKFLHDWRKSKIEDQVTREKQWMLINVLDEFKVQLNVISQSG